MHTHTFHPPLLFEEPLQSISFSSFFGERGQHERLAAVKETLCGGTTNSRRIDSSTLLSHTITPPYHPSARFFCFFSFCRIYGPSKCERSVRQTEHALGSCTHPVSTCILRLLFFFSFSTCECFDMQGCRRARMTQKTAAAAAIICLASSITERLDVVSAHHNVPLLGYQRAITSLK